MPNDPQIHYTRPEYQPGDVRRYDPPAYLPQPMTSQVVALAVYSARISANTQGRNPWSIYWSDAMAVIVPTVLTWPRPEESMAKLRDLFRSVHQAAVSELVAVMWPAPPRSEPVDAKAEWLQKTQGQF